jgi:ABC-type transport system involved in multi-copper enzyme maturation permease subunit
MTGIIAAEVLKLRKRPAVWILGAILLLYLVLLAYLAPWFFLSHLPRGPGLPRGLSLDQIKSFYHPSAMPRLVVQVTAQVGGPICLILGVLSCGSEYGWGTLVVVFVQRFSRLATFAGRLLALALVVLALDVAAYALAGVTSVGLALVDGKPIVGPPAFELAKAIAATWLILSAWCGLGLTLSVAFRQSALAIGVGLVYMLVIEGILLGILGLVGGELVRDVQRLLPGPNAGALAGYFGTGSFVQGAPAQTPLVGAGQASGVLALYLLAFCLVSAAIIRNRDVA